NSGITVNGQMAMLDANNNFYATIPLVAGANAITATLTAQSRQTATQVINVSSDGVPPPMGISADAVEGVGRRTVTLTVSGEGAHLTNISSSGGAVTFTQSGDALIGNYSAPGTYTTSVTASDSSGHTVVKTWCRMARSWTASSRRCGVR